MADMAKRIFLITTESSGDQLASQLLPHLYRLYPDLCVWGAAGPRAREAGMSTLYSVEDFNVMGLVEILGKLKQLKAQFNDLIERCKLWKPDVVILIDAPDFNIRFAKALKGSGIPVVYYVSPQVWAWRMKRAAQIAGLVDHMMVLFEFEKAIYQDLGLNTTWVGHPLVDEITEFSPDPTVQAEIEALPGRRKIVIAPGSRPSELKRHLPVFEEVVADAPDDVCFLLPLAPALNDLDLGLLGSHDRVKVLRGHMRTAMKASDAAVVASGTATLETGLLGTPMVVGYRMNSLTYAMARRLVDVEHFALVNIVLGKGVVSELLQKEFCSKNIWLNLNRILDEQGGDSMKKEFKRLPEILGGTGAGRRAAKAVGEFL